MKNRDNLYDKLNKYAQSDFVPFHMPGHKRNYEKFSLPDAAGIDITEIDGFDDYHYPQGIIKEIQEQAARIYGSRKSYYLVNGSSGGILTAVSAVCSRGEDILAARNCHKALYNAISLNGLMPHYIYPQMDERTGIMGAVTPSMVREALNCKMKALVITSPTYEGIVSDIEEISDICHNNGTVLIVDAAHGAHFNFNEAFPKTAILCGADIVIESLHKTLPCYTQTAIMHVNGDLVDYDRVKRYISVYQTSSPSYIFMAGINKCIDYMVSDEGTADNNEYVSRLSELREEIKRLNNIVLYEDENAFDIDISKLVLSVPGRGVWLYDMLLSRYHIQPEMAASDYIILMTSIGDKYEWYQYLIKALREIDAELKKENYAAQVPPRRTMPKTKVALKPGEAFDVPKENSERVLFAKAAGRISLEWLYAYPPGIPIIYPGEEITGEVIGQTRNLKEAGVVLKGMADADGDYIVCIK
jgi:arginine/lysine/ornithine decarboxylase